MAIAMTPPVSDTAWHLFFLKLHPSIGIVQQIVRHRDCTAVLKAKLANVPERVLHVAPLRLSLQNALFPNPCD